MSEPVDWRELDRRFTARRRARLAAGELEYGDQGFRRPASASLDEAEEELLDLANYAMMAWARLCSLRERLRRMESA